MIEKPVIIVGAPRSGTSLLQKIIRDYDVFWSLPSESDIIWDRYCHPRFRNWDSDYMDEHDLTETAKRKIRARFERLMQPARVWQVVEGKSTIWSFARPQWIKPFLKYGYQAFSELSAIFSSNPSPRRLVEKSVNNSFRIGYVNAVFPDARFLFITRDGRNNVNSLINSWQHPTRFVSYTVPVDLHITGYDSSKQWKFTLPPGWRSYTKASIGEVCAFQWQSTNEAILQELSKEKYSGRTYRLRLEDLISKPDKILREIAAFLELPYDEYFERLSREIPIINSPDNDPDPDKWKKQNQELVASILPTIGPTMKKLGYNDQATL